MEKLLTTALCILILSCSISGCKKFIEVDSPKTSINSKNVYSNDATAIGAVTSLYINMASTPSISGTGEFTTLSCMAGLSADELTYYNAVNNPVLAAYYRNSLTSLNVGNEYWGTAYKRIFLINSALEGLVSSNSLTPAVKQQLIGEARFMRAFYYFYLVNLFGDVPLVLSTDYTVNALVRKSSKEQVYEQIISDLKEAKNSLSTHYLTGNLVTPYPEGTEERVRPTKWAAIALLARVYLFTKDWINAESQADLILANSGEYKLENINQVFLKNNKEAIWQLQPVEIGVNSIEANTFILPSGGPSSNNPVYLNDRLVNGFEDGDLRKVNWVGSVSLNGLIYRFPQKYKVVRTNVSNASVVEYTTVMRLAEQILIRAEARARQGNLVGAIIDLDEIRNRAGLLQIKISNPTINQSDLLKVILKDKRFELFTEWGHRWLDLKRTGLIDEVMKLVVPQKGNSLGWQNNQQYYPISLFELQANPNLSQVNGY